ncbi:MAG: hypothetical protein K0U86_05310 [Planctomycetes bacterium]|nr:hypothetical protein [Planctomycetota bacterium]MCH9724307.1 hypothetical protein [Planctomycetota bacterium]MCH9777326.1 hypothetical protein [Planctomycetota bacterium]MCH9793612.1 hypothetical protein [Planctomycetota bacterium]MDF1743909.1 hypothetical protein [Gimesia sp.]
MSDRQFQFNSFELSGWTITGVCAIVLALVTIILLFRYERRLVPPSIGNILITLRVLALLFILLTFLEPVLTWSFDTEKTGRLVVAIDVSDSMNTQDLHASDLEKLRLARALKMIGNKKIDARLDRWEKSFSLKEEPEWVDESESANPEKRDPLAASRKQNLYAIFEEIDQLSRKQIAQKLLLNPANPILEKLQERGLVDLVLFAGNAVTADQQTLETSLTEVPDQVHMELSNLSEALKASPGSSDTGSAPISSYILLTDGRDNSQLNPVTTAEQLGQMQVPIYPVIVGSTYQPKDISIAALDYPQTAFKDDRPLLKARIGSNGYEGQEVTVILKQNDREVAVKKFTSRGVSHQIEFELESQKLGRQEYTLHTDILPGETRDDNNTKDFAVNIVDDKSHVLLIDETARWEFRFLHNALERDKRVDLQQVLFEQPYMGLLPQPFFPDELPTETPEKNDGPIPENKSHPFGEKDLIIIGDVSPEHLKEENWEQIKTFVSDQGGTLVLLAGKKFLPLGHRSKILDELLPLKNLKVVDWNQDTFKVPPGKRGMRLELTPEGEAEPLFQFDVNPENNREIWKQLPGHLWFLEGEKKPGATVLAYGVSPFNAPLDDDTDGVIIQQQYGSGQVIWIGIDSTWRWRFRVGDRYHHRFWGQMARSAARNKAAAGNEFVKFSLTKTDIDAGEISTASARWTQEYLAQFPDVKSSVAIYKVSDPEKVIASFDLIKQKSQPLIHEANIPPLPPGEYQLKLTTSPEVAKGKEITTPLFVHQIKTIELGNLASNPQLLSEIAESSGGQLLAPETIDQLLDLIPSLNQKTTNQDEISLWDHWLILVLIMGILTAEWAIRKLNGLP